MTLVFLKKIIKIVVKNNENAIISPLDCHAFI